MSEKIFNVLFFVTAFGGLIGLTTIVLMSEMTGPVWIGVMAAIGLLTTIAFGLLLLGGLLFAGFIALCKWADQRNANQPL